MKWIICGISGLLLTAILIFVPLFGKTEQNTEYLRIHIRANSNSQEDQRVKYMVKDAIVEALIPILAEAETKEEAEELIQENFSYIDAVANAVLASEGFSYQGKTRLAREEFPLRAYDDITLPAGEYDAVIVDLGSGKGDNWWCLVYPAFCFTNSTNSTNYVYISKIWEIIKSVSR